MSKFVFYPENKQLRIEKVESTEAFTGILVPENYKKDEKFGVFKLLSVQPDSKYTQFIDNSLILVYMNMVEETTVMGEKIVFCPESAVIGTLHMVE